MLGRDWAAMLAARFGGRLSTATITRKTVTGYNALDPAGPPDRTTTVYTCDAIAWAYKRRFVDGEQIKKADYKVTILRGTVKDSLDEASDFTPDPGDDILVPPPGSDTPKAARVVDIVAITDGYVTVQVRGVP